MYKNPTAKTAQPGSLAFGSHAARTAMAMAPAMILVTVLALTLSTLSGCSWIRKHTPGMPLPHERHHYDTPYEDNQPWQQGRYETTNQAAKVVKALRGLHQKALSSARQMPRMEIVPPPQRRITLIWTNAAAEIPSAYVTGVVGSTNLRNWYQVARLPYATSNVVTLSNRPPMEFYRAYNAIAWQ